jgi:hypothetical protein
MEPEDIVLFARVRLKDSTINVPFVCQKCGKCCKELSHVLFDPERRKIIVENGEEIENFLGLSFYETLEEIELNTPLAHLTHFIMLNPCPFLKDGKCMVYPVRPNSCRLFPLQAGDYGVGCSAFERFRRALEHLEPSDSDVECMNMKLENVQKAKPPEYAVKIYLKTATEEEKEAFFRLNYV